MSFSLPARQAFYADTPVRTRIMEYLEGAMFLATGTEWESHHRVAEPRAHLSEILVNGGELTRSLWDRRRLLAHLDIEYVNFDFAALPYEDPRRTFALQQPVIETAVQLLGRVGIRPLHLLTGRGHHLTWALDRKSRAFDQLARLGRPTDTALAMYREWSVPGGEHVDERLARAFSGLGLVMEFLAAEIKQLAAPHCTVPVELGAIEVGAGRHGREMISIDITEYADPLSARVIRAPFSVYLKALQQRGAMGEAAAEAMPPCIVVPMSADGFEETLAASHDPRRAAALANHVTTEIPDGSAAMEALIERYETSATARFHQWFYSEAHDPRELWPQSYDRMSLEPLPPCVREMLAHPNDTLLRPACVARVVRVLLSLGWHPRHIGGLIRSRYERDFGWGDQWRGCDPATRADFYARVFAGLFVTGVDELVDFNCQSAREEGLCFVQNCTEDLARFRQSLLDRSHHERLAHRPLHGLFLPAEHL